MISGRRRYSVFAFRRHELIFLIRLGTDICFAMLALSIYHIMECFIHLFWKRALGFWLGLLHESETASDEFGSRFGETILSH